MEGACKPSNFRFLFVKTLCNNEAAQNFEKKKRKKKHMLVCFVAFSLGKKLSVENHVSNNMHVWSIHCVYIHVYIYIYMIFRMFALWCYWSLKKVGPN